MAERVPDSHLDLFEKRAYCFLATLMPDGGPHVTPVWVDYDGEHILINSSAAYLKSSNMAARAQVGMTIQDPDSPFRYLSIRGRVVAIVEEADGAREHINKMSLKYDGEPIYEGRPGETRRLFKILPDRVVAKA